MIYALIALGLLLVVPVARELLKPRMGPVVRTQSRAQFVKLSQGVTGYEWYGPSRGPVAVCVHGLTTPSFVWAGLVRGLTLLGYRVLVYDLYGRGYSDRPRGRQTEAFFLRQMNDLLTHQQVTGAFTLFGYSMGGAIATCFAAAHPERVRQLVLLAPAGLSNGPRGLAGFIVRTPVVGDWLMLALFPSQHRRGCEAERQQPGATDALVDLQLNELRYRGYVAAVLSSLRGILAAPLEAQHRALSAAGVPVLAIWGRDDRVIALTAMGKLAEWNRTAEQDIVEDAGHGLVYTHTAPLLDALRAGLKA